MKEVCHGEGKLGLWDHTLCSLLGTCLQERSVNAITLILSQLASAKFPFVESQVNKLINHRYRSYLSQSTSSSSSISLIESFSFPNTYIKKQDSTHSESSASSTRPAMAPKKLYPRSTIKKMVKALSSRSLSKNADVLVSHASHRGIKCASSVDIVLTKIADISRLHPLRARVSLCPTFDLDFI